MNRIVNLILVILLASLAVSAGPPPQPSGEREAHPPIHVRGSATPTYQAGYQPLQVVHAYGVDQVSATGANQLIAIVDAYGSPTIQNDLAVFSAQFGLPAANLTIAYPQGPPNRTEGGWALETSLDVEWAHALAPNAPILLVVAKTNSFNNLLAAVDYASSHGAKVVSMSWGGGEFSSEASYDYHFNHTGVVFTASSGDSGAGVLWPAASPYVVAVGGTTLPLDGSGNLTGSETAWSGSGGGISGYETEPGYQSAFPIPNTNGKRGVPDVSSVADPNTGLAVYDSTSYQGQSGWWQVGGTSAGAPLWAAVVALADQLMAPGSLSSNNLSSSAFYNAAAGAAYASNYRDITSGSNGSCGGTCTAGTGYDFVTGLGSPLTNSLVPFLASSSPSPTPTPTATPTPTPAATPTPTPTPTATPTPTPAATPTPTPTPTATPTPTPTAALSVTVSTDKGSYPTGATVTVTVAVASGGASVSGAAVALTISDPSGAAVSSQTGATDSTGTAVFSYAIPANAASGTYTAQAAASASGYSSGSGAKNFRVR